MHIKTFFSKSTVTGQFIRNGIVAVVTLAVDYSVFWSLRNSMDSTLALAIGYCSGVVVNFVLCTIWVFTESRYSSRLKQFAIFSFYASTGLLVEITVFSVLKHMLVLYMARIVSIIVTFFWNFALKELVIFRKKGKVSLRQVMSSYDSLTIPERLYLVARFITYPVEKVVSYLPNSGNVLEIGTGSGINLVVAKTLYPKLVLTGTDIDERKLKICRKIQLDSTTFTTTDPLTCVAKYDAILIADVLYLMSPEEQKRVLDKCMAILNPGGRLVVKEMSEYPKWKSKWNLVQEYISVHITKMTSHSSQNHKILYAEDIKSYLAGQGHNTHIHHLDKKYIHPHALVVVE